MVEISTEVSVRIPPSIPLRLEDRCKAEVSRRPGGFTLICQGCTQGKDLNGKRDIVYYSRDLDPLEKLRDAAELARKLVCRLKNGI